MTEKQMCAVIEAKSEPVQFELDDIKQGEYFLFEGMYRAELMQKLDDTLNDELEQIAVLNVKTGDVTKSSASSLVRRARLDRVYYKKIDGEQ